MRGSAFSMSSTSKISTKQIEENCPDHDGEAYTNFCSAITCVKPLCPQCIENHYHHHKNIRTPPEIDSFKSLKNKCINKVGAVIDQLGGEGDLSMAELNNIFENSIRRVRQTRDRCRKILDSYFGNLQDFIKNKISKTTGETSQIFVEADRIKNIVTELSMLCTQLDNPRTFLQSAGTVVKLDCDKIEEKVREGQLTIKKFKENYKNVMFIEKNYEHLFYNFLSSIAYYGNKENLDSNPKIVEQIMAQERSESISRERTRSRNRQDETDSHIQSKVERHESRESRERPKEVGEDDKRSTFSRKSSSKGLKGVKRQIIGMNTFQSTSVRKYLHFFEAQQNILHYLDLEEGEQFQKFPIDINFTIPDFHKSISISNGDLYLIGGSLNNGGVKSPKIYKYDFERNSLVYCNSLKHGRSSHSVCFNNRYIYVIGGYVNNQQITNRCERYDILSNKVEQIRPLPREACSIACCAFSGRYIYAFGGTGPERRSIQQIDRFDEKTGMWETVNPFNDLKNQSILALSTSAAVQITKQEIMVMGGYDDDNMGQKQTYILRVQESGAMNLQDINMYPLPLAEGFWNNIPIVHKKLIFVLQNVTTSANSDECSASMRKILVFDGAGWKTLN